MSETTTGTKRPRKNKVYDPLEKKGERVRWFAHFDEISHKKHAGEGMQALFPGTEAEVIDLPVIVAGVIQQAREDGVDLGKFARMAAKFAVPWRASSLKGTSEPEIKALGFQTMGVRNSLRPGLLLVCLLLCLHRMHAIHHTMMQSIREGDEISFRKAIRAILYGGDCSVADIEEFIEAQV